jgi:hypothetical protein
LNGEPEDHCYASIFISVASISIEEKETVESPRMEDSQEDDSIIELSLPWLKPVNMVKKTNFCVLFSLRILKLVTYGSNHTLFQIIQGLNHSCTHQGFCLPSCVRRQARGCRRLMEAIREVNIPSCFWLL